MPNKTPMSRFHIHDDLTAPEASLPILKGLQSVLADRTSVIVSHRVSAVMNADLILVLDDGRIVERGTHAELIARDGVYSTLLRRQILAEEIDREPLTASTTND